MESKKASTLAEDYTSQFALTKVDIQKQIDELGDTSNAEVISKLNLISEDIHKLSKTLQDSTLFLPSYSVKVRQNEIRVLETELKMKEDLLVPKKKFGFKSKIVKPDLPADIAESEISAVSEKPAPEKDDSNFLTIENVEGSRIIYTEEQLSKSDVMVRNLDGAVIHLNGSPSTLRLANLKNCKLICGPVHTSVFVDECSNCVFFLCCQQLRTHSSEDLDIYLRVRSRAIIEDCKKIKFAPYNWNHARSEELHRLAEIDVHLERFDCVDDFNWLAFSTPSPNWTIIPEEERIAFPPEILD